MERKEIIKILKDEKKILEDRLDNSIKHFHFEDCVKMQSALIELKRICKLLDLEREVEVDEEKD